MTFLPEAEVNATLDVVAEWLDDRARLLRNCDPDASLELSVIAGAVRDRHLLPGGIIACAGQPYPTNGGKALG